MLGLIGASQADRAEMAMTYSDSDGIIRKRSGWMIPLGVFLVTLVLSALLLIYYLAPSAPNFLEEQASPTARTDLVALRVHGLKLWIPANYLQYASSRRGGAFKDVSMFALLPDLAGWSDDAASTFAGNTADSPVVYILIRDERLNLPEADRFSRIYLAYVANKKGTAGPFGLTQYAFRDDTGYRNEDLFVGQTSTGPQLLRCVRFSPRVPNPSCLRDTPIAHNVALSYRFKRAYLGQWREIGQAIGQLVARFKEEPHENSPQGDQPRH
jgi:hypothetical protein